MRLFVASLFALGLLLPSCTPAQTTGSATTAQPETPADDDVIDSDFAGSTNAVEFPQGMTWLNTDQPLSLRDLRGKIVLLDFWTYCCINCIHVLPDLARIEEEYPEVVVIGVHSAKFENEQDAENIRQAILRYEIAHPVAVDNDFYLWKQYGVRAWPSFVLIDPRGKYVGSASGEGVYQTLKPYLEGMKKLFNERGLLNADRVDFALERQTAPGSPISYPGKLDVDAKTGRLFFTDSNHNRVIVIDEDGRVQAVIGTGARGKTDGGFDQATFLRPQGVSYDAATDALFVADTENHLIRRINFRSQTVETLVGSGVQSPTYNTYANGVDDPLNSPWDVLYQNGTLYIAMAGPHQLWTLDPTTRQAKRYAGSGRENIVDGPLEEAALAQPSGLASDGQNLYFADSEVSALRMVSGTEVKTLIGQGLFEFGDVDGTYPAARLQHVLGVTWHQGKLYVADTYNHKIKVYDPSTKRLTTLLGSGKRGNRDGKATEAEFSEPNDLAWLNGKLYILDTNNHLIRVFDPKTGRVSTLTLPAEQLSLLPTARTATDLPFYGDAVALSQTDIRPGATVTLRVQLPTGYKLNTNAPNYLEIIGLNTTTRAFEVKEGVLTAHLKLPQTLPAELTVEAGLYYCEEGREAVCKIKQVRFTVALNPTPAGTNQLVLPYKLPE